MAEQSSHQLAAATTEFAIDLHRALSSSLGSGADGNMCFSAVSVSAALAMCLLGARGDTAAQLKSALRLGDLDDEAVHAGFAEFISGLGKEGLPYVLRVANRLYARAGYTFLDAFTEATKKHYHADSTVADFAGNAEAARADINAWVAGETGERISELLPAGAVNELTALVLVNAVYFKGEWFDKFDPRGTHSRAFIVNEKDMVDTDYMFKSRYFNYARSEELDCRALEIPYANKDLSFFLLLPNTSDGLAAMEGNLSRAAFSALLAAMKPAKVEVYIPKFRMEFGAALTDALGGLGVTDLFTAGLADLSGMDGGRQLAVSSAVHKASIEVNEEGSEAAAASGLSVELVSLGDMNEFVAQHPFLYLIHDNKSGVPLFMGRYCHP